MNENLRNLIQLIAQKDQEIKEFRWFPEIQERKRAEREILVQQYRNERFNNA